MLPDRGDVPAEVRVPTGRADHQCRRHRVAQPYHGQRDPVARQPTRKGTCRVYDSNFRIRAARSARYVSPDAFVLRGPREFDPEIPEHTTALNPKLIVETLSPSTELSDRSEMFAYSLQCPTLEEYVMIARRETRVETCLRQSDGTWSPAAAASASPSCPPMR
jgi:Uma2 family endonuclease